MQTATELRGAQAARLVPGLLAGTLLLTRDGEIPVEHLVPGDRVITRDAGLVTLRALEREVAVVAPVRILAGSLGHTRPERDMRLAPGTAVHVRDWRAAAMFGRPAAQVAALRLVDGEFVALEEEGRHVLFRPLFDRPHIIYAEGLEIAV